MKTQLHIPAARIVNSRHCEKRSDEAIQDLAAERPAGLLRYARNDGKGAVSATLGIIVGMVLIGLFGLAQPATAAVSVTDAWTRATAGSTTCAVYFNVTSTIADRLTGARSQIAVGAVLHLHKISNGIITMRALDGVDLAAGKIFSFAPLGYHIMLTGLKTPLKPGDRFPLTLIFAEAGDVTADVLVKPLRDRHVPTTAPAMDAVPGMDDMGNMK